MTNTITKERRDAIRAAAEKAMPSPWRSDRTGLYVWAASAKLKDDTFPLADGGGNDAVIARMRGWGYYTGKGGGALALSSDEAVAAIRRDLDHIANCDPQTILALLDALDAAEAKMGEPVACGGCGTSDPESRCVGCLHDFYTAPPDAKPVIPEGWVLVPREPTHWALYSVSGSHIGLWTDKEWVERLQTQYPGSTILPLAPAPALVSEKEAE